MKPLHGISNKPPALQNSGRCCPPELAMVSIRTQANLSEHS